MNVLQYVHIPTQKMSSIKSGLALVQNLYVLQIELARFLESKEVDAEERKKAKENYKEFSSLLTKADLDYMGGEDVFDALKDIRIEVSMKMKQSSKPRKMKKATDAKVVKVAKKVVKKPTAKKVAPKKKVKKAAAKKVVAKKAAPKKKVLKKKK